MLRAEARGAASAIAFLTTLPVGRVAALNADDLARAAPAFPLVGAALGAAVGGVAAIAADPLTPGLAAALALALGALLTGAMHIDATADAADALGVTDRVRALEVMRDPSIGAFGAAAIVLMLLVQATALAALAASGAVGTVAASFALARTTAPALAAALPDARRGRGLGASLATARPLRPALGAGVAVTAAVSLCGPVPGIALAGTALGCAVVAGVAARRRFGGVTGDILGATIAVTETACLCVAVALAQHSAGWPGSA